MTFELNNVIFNNKSKKQIRTVRENVFINEQGISPEIEFDGLDNSAIHAVLCIKGQAVGTGRILNDGHIGRIAVISEFRNKGLGSKIVISLIDEAIKKGYKRVYLGAQKQAIDFYSKLGFTPFGETFIEAGIAHLSMEKILP